MTRIAISESEFDSACRASLLGAIPAEEVTRQLQTLFHCPNRIFSHQLSESSVAFLLQMLTLALAFARQGQNDSRLYIKVQTVCALSREALGKALQWLQSDQRFDACLPACRERDKLFAEWHSMYPPPFTGRQRLHLLDGALIVDLKFVVADGRKPASVISSDSLPDSRPAASGRRIAILGSGIAGCHLAAALAEKGARVTVLERSVRPHDGASGNRQGALYIKPGLNWSRENELHVLSYLYASRRYRRRFDGLAKSPWLHCGVLHLAQSDRETKRMKTLHSASGYPSSFISELSDGQTELEAGTSVKWPASLMPHGGTLEPGRLCRMLLDHAFIKLVTGVEQLEHAVLMADYDAVVWAGGYPGPGDAFAPARLPLRPIRGQLSSVLLPDAEGCPQRVLSGEGYVMPMLSTLDNAQHDSGHWLTFGASYHVNSSDIDLRQSDSAANLVQLDRTLPQLADRIRHASSKQIERSGLRCASTDYMPVVGQARSDQLARDSEAVSMAERDRLWFMTSFGSKGLALTPLLAEHLACVLLGEPPPLEPHLAAACAPDRFRARAALKTIRQKSAVRAGRDRWD